MMRPQAPRRKTSELFHDGQARHDNSMKSSARAKGKGGDPRGPPPFFRDSALGDGLSELGERALLVFAYERPADSQESAFLRRLGDLSSERDERVPERLHVGRRFGAHGG